MKTTKLLLQCVMVFGLMFLLSGCLVSAQGRHAGIVVAEDSAPQPTAQKTGPPAHAKAYGFRAQHRYYFYPDSSVYFDTGRSVYFYLDSSGAWRMAVSLPRSLQISLGDRVTIEMESDRPYTDYDEHRKNTRPRRRKNINGSE